MRAKAKLIASLIKRIEVRLPINNTGTTIESLEQDALTQQTVAAIIELSIYKLSVVVNQLALVLEVISKDIQPSTTTDAYVPLDVLQSQLFIIRLLSACLQYHWNWYKKRTIKLSEETNVTEEALAAAAATGAYSESIPNQPKEDPSFDPPPLDEVLVSFLLNLMGRFLNQFHVIEERSDQLLMSTSEHTNDTVVNASKVDTQTMDYIREVYSASGKILRYISSSNWNSFYMKIKNAINILVAANENSELNPPEIRILAFANLNASKLQTVLTEFSPYFLNMKIQGKLLFAKMLRATIWKWIETRPAEFAEICVSNKKNLAGSEILFDMCNIAADSSRKKAVLWPLQTILLTLSPDLLIQAFLDDRGLQNRRTGFPRQLRKALESVRTQEIAATCYVDLCKAASFVSPNDDTILRHIAEDVEDVLREKVWDFSRPSAIDSLSSSLGYTISQQTLASDYLLAQLQLNSSRAIYTLIPSLLDDDAPTVFRQAFVNACLNIASEEHPLSWHTTLNSLYGAICTPLRRILIQTVKIELAVRSEISSMTSGSRKTINSDKRLQNTTSLLQAMLKLFRMDPCSVLMGTDEKVRVEENTLVMTSIANLMKHQDRRMRQAAVDCLTQLHDPSTIIHWGPSNSIMSTFWKISSQVVSSIARQILDNTRQNEELMNALFDLLSNTLDARNSFLIDVSESCVVHDLYDSHERHQAMVTLEVALLVSLCSSIPDICSKSVKCLGYICKESKIVDGDSIFGDSSSRSSQSTYAYNYNIEIYERLCSEEPMAKGGLRKQLFVGRKAQQKRLRRYLRLMTVPTPGNMLAWEEVWKRWRILTQVVSRYGIDTLKDTSDTATIYSTSSSVKKIGGLVRHDKLRVTSVRTAGSTMSTMLPSPVPVSRVEIDDEKQTEWQNYTGFLAALGGCRLATDADDENIHEDGSRKSKSASSDRIGSPTTKSALLAEKFITEMVELLTSENVVIREAVKDTLGNDLSPALYATLFRQIEAIMKNCFSSNGEVLCNSTNTLFVEQSVLVLKMVLDRLVNANDCLVSVDFSTIVLYFINYINRLPHNNYTTMRTMIMMCHLTESLMSKMDQIIIRDDVRVKNRLLEIIIEWTSSFNPSSTTEINNIQNKEVQRDLDQICLKAIVALLRKLPLQISEQSRDTDRAMSKSRLFQKYFTFFIQLLERCHRYEAESSQPLSGRGLHTSTLLSKTTDTYWGPLKESAVNAISNLLNANVEVGLRSTLAMGYHEDPKMRSAFMQVLANILNAGAQFDTLADTIVNDRYEKLVELLVESDMDLALSICDVCPAVDAPNVTEVLLNVFESKNKILPLLKAIVEREVSSADEESTLFRGTNMATRMLSTFARNTCADYVRMTLQSAMESINALSDIQLTWEMDPLKEALPENLLKNKQNVCRVTEILMDAICNSIPNAPTRFRQELSFLADAVSKRFPDATEIQVGGFVFLRLFNPAILTPENSGVSKKAIPRTKNVRKILLQATRLMQNLANNVMFGAKEPHLISLNDFITNNLYRVANFLREISTAPSTISIEEARCIRLDTIDYIKLHKYLSENIEKIFRNISGRRFRIISSDTQKILEIKRTLEKFTTLLGQLGPPPDIAQEETSMARNYAVASTNTALNDFMRRNKNRDLSPIRALNMVYQGGVSRGGHPVFYMVTRCLFADNVDYELLIYYFLRILEPSLNRPFELVFDLTRFSEDCELPLHWFNQLFTLIFNEMNDYMVALHIFNPNFHLQRYVRSMPREFFNKLVKRLKFSSTISEFSQHIAPSEIQLPKDTCEIEKDIGMTIKHAFLLDSLKTMTPVQLKIGTEYFQVTTLQEQEVFWTLHVTLNNVYSMDDLVNISLPPIQPNKKGSNEGEIHITVDRGKSTLMFIVPNREEVYKYLLDRKKKFETSNTEDNDEIRPTDVPGRMLNMALLNMGSEDYNLRLSAYSLLCALSISFRFGVSTSVIHSKDVFIPYNDMDFIVNISENIAASETHLTLEFLNECILGFDRSNIECTKHILTLEYMVPWLKNIPLYIYGPNGKDVHKVRELIRSLINLTAEKQELYEQIQRKIWKTLGEIEEIHNIILDCLVQYSVEHGLGSHHAEVVSNTLVTMNCISIRAKIIIKLRKCLSSTSQNCRSTLVKHPVWNEIACLVRAMVAVSFFYASLSESFLAECFHVVALLASTGPTLIRSSIHGLVVNAIHMLITSECITVCNRKKLKYLMNDVGDGKYRVHFGLNKSYANAFTITEETMSDNMESINLASLEIIVQLLLEVTSSAAPNADTANAWRARWMSLATSMTFQFNPSLQPRSFVILGCLAQDEIDDDLLFQILVVLRNELAHFDETNSQLAISILMCLKNVVNNLSASSRYLKPMFWAAISMIQMDHSVIFPHAVKLLHAILRNMDANKFFDRRSIQEVMMAVRAPFASVMLDIDAASGVSFDTQFSFAVAGTLLKGFQFADARENVLRCLATFLEIETKINFTPNRIDARCLGYFAGLLPFAAKNDSLSELLPLAGIIDLNNEMVTCFSSDVHTAIWRAIDIPNNTTGILLVSFLVGMLSLAENEAERLFLYGILSKAAVSTPEVFALVYESLIPKMSSIVVSSDNVALIEAVKKILITACSEQAFSSTERASQQRRYLENIGFSSFGEINFGSMNTTFSVSAKLTSELLRMICE